MCTSVLQIVFTVVLVIGTAATLVSMFTPGWRNTKFSINNVTNAIVNPPKSAGGIFQFLCSDANTGTTSNANAVPANSTSPAATCEAYWQNKPTWEKVVIAAMCVALLAELAAIAWSFVMCFTCCCKSCLAPPLPIITAIATICLLVAVVLFGVKNKSQITSVPVPTSTGQLNAEGNVGYSFWVAVLALIAMGVDTILAVLLAKSASVSPI